MKKAQYTFLFYWYQKKERKKKKAKQREQTKGCSMRYFKNPLETSIMNLHAKEWPREYKLSIYIYGSSSNGVSPTFILLYVQKIAGFSYVLELV